MVSWLLGLLPFSGFAVALEVKTHGVPPSLLPRYTPSSSGKWTCLDHSKEIPWTAVNDDYCDCPDGSDEPGTSACPSGSFYCLNLGHIGMSIPSTRVNDGLCEPECCDGSDEQPGVCKNTCKLVGQAYRKQRDAERAIQQKGAKIRASYIAFARKERARLETLVLTTKQEIVVREREANRLRDISEGAQKLSTLDSKHRQESPLFKSLLEHAHVLKSLRQLHQKALEREKALGVLLEALKTGYNPNYQDMAVLEAVRGWEFLKGKEVVQDADDEAEAEKEVSEGAEQQQENELDQDQDQDQDQDIPAGDGLLSAHEVEEQIGGLLDTDYEILLLEHDKHVNALPSRSVLFNLTAYLPDFMIPQYDSFKESLRGVLQVLGIASGSAETSDEAARARKAFETAEDTLHTVRSENEKATEDLQRLNDVKGFGKDGEWKKLDGTCIEKNTGDYTYELCFFGEAKQKTNNGGFSNRLGRFTSWNTSPDVSEGSPEYYSKQVYKDGDKCWNGPFRSVVFVLKCGAENTIETVEELEKCEYQFTGTSPALCLPLEETDRAIKKEF